MAETVSPGRINSALCRSCDFLADELERLRRLLDAEVRESRWFGHRAIVEYSRLVRNHPDRDYLYVHCEPAWGETLEEFEARYDRVVATERNRLRVRAPKRQTVVARRPEPVDDIFSGRIE